MSEIERAVITVSAEINVPVKLAWELWTLPTHIMHWNSALDTWHTSWAENDPRTGGSFNSRMEARDGCTGFNFSGTYSLVEIYKRIEYQLGNDRKVTITFEDEGDKTLITESFDAELINPVEMQRAGWQAILGNFKKYAESKTNFEILHFETLIKASPEKVFDSLTGKDTYGKWTQDFNPTARFEGSWNKNSRIVFLGVDKDGHTGGMLAMIKENIPGKFLSIEHLGVVENSKEHTEGPEAEVWKGSLENYTFRQVEEGTLFSVDMDSEENFREYFLKTWPLALNRLKQICEN